MKLLLALTCCLALTGCADKVDTKGWSASVDGDGRISITPPPPPPAIVAATPSTPAK